MYEGLNDPVMYSYHILLGLEIGLWTNEVNVTYLVYIFLFGDITELDPFVHILKSQTYSKYIVHRYIVLLATKKILGLFWVVQK